MRMLLSDPQVREAAGRRARERVRHGYLWPQITADIERTYLTLTERDHIRDTVSAPEARAA
jgi:glycosyltransferase involved in cell wall biosynthesis